MHKKNDRRTYFRKIQKPSRIFLVDFPSYKTTLNITKLDSVRFPQNQNIFEKFTNLPFLTRFSRLFLLHPRVKEKTHFTADKGKRARRKKLHGCGSKPLPHPSEHPAKKPFKKIEKTEPSKD